MLGTDWHNCWALTGGTDWQHCWTALMGTGGWHWWAQVGWHRWVALLDTGRWHFWAQVGGTGGVGALLGTGGCIAGHRWAELVCGTAWHRSSGH
ncbi:unnamed protein product [Staurois parvus]|uniref:Uncharacterized protein n=1 Tax=Staurois parvus TaxID=386267 RepID=A0ABN9GYA9_9NEOB|nr:unnamed protein product [Staurois parvus]